MRKQLTRADLEFQMFTDYYKIYQDFYEPEDDDGYWESLIYAVGQFHRKYNTKLAMDLAMAYLNSREELFKLKSA